MKTKITLIVIAAVTMLSFTAITVTTPTAKVAERTVQQSTTPVGGLEIDVIER